jgi:hypothetical protein
VPLLVRAHATDLLVIDGRIFGTYGERSIVLKTGRGNRQKLLRRLLGGVNLTINRIRAGYCEMGKACAGRTRCCLGVRVAGRSEALSVFCSIQKWPLLSVTEPLASGIDPVRRSPQLSASRIDPENAESEGIPPVFACSLPGSRQHNSASSNNRMSGSRHGFEPQFTAQRRNGRSAC